MRKKIVISAVNLVEGGPLDILQKCLEYLSEQLSDRYQIIALVNDKNLANYENVEYIEYKSPKKSWITRLFYEYFYFKHLSQKMDVFLWLSLHDITPNVSANRQAVYCHNASPFYNLSLKDAFMDPRFALFNKFYKYLYAINIKSNDLVIVQQDWMRNKFIELYKLSNVIVSSPTGQDRHFFCTSRPAPKNNNLVFFYPAFPRIFKNFEIIGKSSEILLKRGISNFEIILTIDGNENRYSRHIYKLFGHIKNIKFLGRQNKAQIITLYENCECVIFPSKLETWGLPLSEARECNKLILAADLPYAHETLGEYDKAGFFSPYNDSQLADMMQAVINRTLEFKKMSTVRVSSPFANNWKDLFSILLSDEI